MYNLRYHIASLVSVFLALAIGLVLGGLAVGRGALDRQEGALVEGLQKEFAQLRDENRVLATENDQLEGFASRAIGGWVVDRLTDRTVVVLAAAGRSDGVVDAREALRSAGAKVAVITLLKPGFGLEDDSIASELATLAATENPRASIATSLAAEWATAGPRPVTQRLVEAGVLRVQGLPEDTAASALVVVAAEDGEPDKTGLSIAQSFATPLTIAVGAETPAARTGVAAAAAEAGLSALDTLGTPVGDYTLIALLSGAEPGYYGTADGADGEYPDVKMR